jgi:hypothetical protein
MSTTSELYIRQDAENARYLEEREQRLRNCPIDPLPPGSWVSICAWCPGWKEKHALATAAGYHVTHGICLPCRDKFFGDYPPKIGKP